ncbi:unnamed protein product [Amoebophrya sp. A120]|nr:unnamed protein product [Amoebophrya sp. A120]|eukprot:GSA120T00013984001.1
MRYRLPKFMPPPVSSRRQEFSLIQYFVINLWSLRRLHILPLINLLCDDDLDAPHPLVQSFRSQDLALLESKLSSWLFLCFPIPHPLDVINGCPYASMVSYFPHPRS